jgi:hypothetical protein
MASTVGHRKAPEKSGSEGKACNFQHLFKMQMMKRERKATHLSTEIKEGKVQKVKIKERSNKIVNLLLNCSINDSSLRQSLDSANNAPTPSSNPKNNPFPVGKTLRTSQH